jgi:hypothetical protein
MHFCRFSGSAYFCHKCLAPFCVVHEGIVEEIASFLWRCCGVFSICIGQKALVLIKNNTSKNIDFLAHECYK